MNKKSLEFLKDLIDTPSPSGFEEPAVEKWGKYIHEHTGLSIKSEMYGSGVCSIDKEEPSIMLCGHIDEVGMMISYINDEGYVYVSALGGIDAYILPTHRVIIYNKNGPVYGVIGQKPIHIITDDDEREMKVYNQFIDIGAKDKEDALTKVSVGDPIVINAPFEELANNRIVARGLDDRMGAWCIAEALVALNKSEKLKASVYGVASVQEENGSYGATISAYNINPDIALAIDVGITTDVPDVSKERWGDLKLGEGPIISIGSVVHKKVSQSLLNVAESNRIPVQIQIEPRWSGTDADAIFMTRGGVATGILSVPNRYMHTPVEMIQLDDLENAVKLIVAWCESIPDVFGDV